MNDFNNNIFCCWHKIIIINDEKKPILFALAYRVTEYIYIYINNMNLINNEINENLTLFLFYICIYA